MAVMNVNPTRMELTTLKKKLVTARRGHKLLKDKRDELMRQFLLLVKENKALRKTVEEKMKRANAFMALASGEMSDSEINVALMLSGQKVGVELKKKNVMSVSVPEYTFNRRLGEDDGGFSYGFAFTSGDLDEAIRIYTSLSEDLLRLAEVEKTCQLLAREIEGTRRRVNALEHVLITDYEDTIKYISVKLEENDRSNITRLMKVKDMMLEKAHNYN
ncbi:MAG: V-type ATP synthase subunit D [Ruminococcaceae bacterium]|nr:V-type ATP synthase subunit D [Oscillospiraceae bacterium]